MKKKIVVITLLIAVGFIIIISFFIFSTTMSQPTAMKLFQAKEYDTAKIAASKNAAVNLVLFNDSNIYAYRGTDYTNGKLCTTTDGTLRKYLLQAKNEVNDSSFIVLIRPSSSGTYKNTVNVLDEMTINDIKRYAMVDVLAEEQKIIDSISKGK